MRTKWLDNSDMQIWLIVEQDRIISGRGRCRQAERMTGRVHGRSDGHLERRVWRQRKTTRPAARGRKSMILLPLWTGTALFLLCLTDGWTEGQDVAERCGRSTVKRSANPRSTFNSVCHEASCRSPLWHEKLRKTDLENQIFFSTCRSWECGWKGALFRHQRPKSPF